MPGQLNRLHEIIITTVWLLGLRVCCLLYVQDHPSSSSGIPMPTAPMESRAPREFLCSPVQQQGPHPMTITMMITMIMTMMTRGVASFPTSSCSMDTLYWTDAPTDRRCCRQESPLAQAEGQLPALAKLRRGPRRRPQGLVGSLRKLHPAVGAADHCLNQLTATTAAANYPLHRHPTPARARRSCLSIRKPTWLQRCI